MIRFESTIAACHKYKAMPVEIEGDLPLLRERLRNATGANRFSVRGSDRQVTITATGELIGYICKEC